MNFETKYLIRWGIPGWVFVLNISLYFLFSGSAEVQDFFLKTNNATEIIAIAASLTILGVPIGYIFHHIYFACYWLICTKHRKRQIRKTKRMVINQDIFWGHGAWKGHDEYFNVESAWHKVLIESSKDESERSKRDYVVERYRYLISTIHGHGALIVSIIFSIGLLAVCMYKFQGYVAGSILGILNLFLLILLIKTFRYYSDNLTYFQGYFFNVLSKNKSNS